MDNRALDLDEAHSSWHRQEMQYRSHFSLSQPFLFPWQTWDGCRRKGRCSHQLQRRGGGQEGRARPWWWLTFSIRRVKQKRPSSSHLNGLKGHSSSWQGLVWWQREVSGPQINSQPSRVASQDGLCQGRGATLNLSRVGGPTSWVLLTHSVVLQLQNHLRILFKTQITRPSGSFALPPVVTQSPGVPVDGSWTLPFALFTS